MISMPTIIGENAEMDLSLEQCLNPGGFEKFAMEELPQFIREREIMNPCKESNPAHPIGKAQIKMRNRKPYVVYNKDMSPLPQHSPRTVKFLRLSLKAQL